MVELLQVVLPVFLVLGAGYAAVWRGLFSDAGVDGLMKFTQRFAIPCLLFRAISELDLGQSFNAPLLASFYTGAAACFLAGILGARWIFKRSWENSVAVGFCCLFSNSVLLGLPIAERAYGSDALSANYAIIAVHSPFCYALGITAMEVVRNRGAGVLATAGAIFQAMFHNALIIGIALGFAVNLSGVAIPGVIAEAVDLMVRAALPAALFGLGGILVRYRPEGDLRAVAYVVCVSLVLHPALVWAMGRWLELPTEAFRAAVITAAMAPGVNTYVFADLYGEGRRVAATGVLVGTALCVISAWIWLRLLG